MRSSTSETKLKAAIAAKAAALGFDACRVTAAHLDARARDGLAAYIAAGHHGTMSWLAETFARRASPEAMWAGARSAVVVAMNYGPEGDPLAVTRLNDKGAISVYARGRDYHDVIKGKLKGLAGKLAAASGCEVKVFVDTAPVMEKPLAQAAGLGWQGKHTNLLGRDLGSWVFLGAIFTTLELEPDAPEVSHCGSCTACLDICPTRAFPAPYQLDARRCISYLTIEHEGPVDTELRGCMGNRIYGCDDCLAVCPWNKFAVAAREIGYQPKHGLPELSELAMLEDAGFRERFAGSPIKRIGRDRFVRNVLYAIGNSALPRLASVAADLAEDADPGVADAARWAVEQLKGD